MTRRLQEPPGLDAYTGHTMRDLPGDRDYDLTGKRVAVIGTGAGAVRVVPELVRRAASVKVFQCAPGWVLPRLDRRGPGWSRALFARVPASVVERAARLHLRAAVRDPWLRRQLTPGTRSGGERPLVSSDYYPALQRANCKLITWPIATLSPAGVRTADGIEHEVDCIVLTS